MKLLQLLISTILCTATLPIGAATNFLSGNINNADDWDNGLPASDNIGTISTSGTNSTTVFGYGFGSTVSMTAGTITSNDGFNIVSGTWNISGGQITTRYLLSNGSNTAIHFTGGTVELSNTSGTQNLGVANGGTMTISGSVVLDCTEANAPVQTNGSLDISSTWTGSWTWGTHSGDDWKNLITGNLNITVDGANIDANTFDALFLVTGGGSVLQTDSSDRPTDIQLSASNLPRTSPIGTLVGTLTSSDPTPNDSFTYSLVSGTGSDGNAWFAIDGDRLETDRDLSNLSETTSVRIRSTDLAGQWLEKSFPIILVNNSDNDGLPDIWELAYFNDLTIATGTGNNDGDNLNNLEELARGTNPTLTDTDGDTLHDDLEDGSGIFNGASDPGSSPLLVDTDADGLTDAEEISNANGYITNPNLQDSDGDGFSDPVEIAAGKNPNSDSDFPAGLLPLQISEILARNESGIRDGFGSREDWIEIYNPNITPVSLDAYYLTDNATELTKWNFPDITIPAGDFLLVFASGKETVDPDNHPHTNFKLSANGEYLAIVRPDATTIDDAFSPAFPEQFTDISYGRHPISGIPQFYDPPNPQDPNPTNGTPGVVKDTNFSHDRGFYDAPFSLTISSDTLDATIRYTTDGSIPTLTTGTTFIPGTPIPITTTTTIRAIAFKAGFLQTNVDTQSYIFVSDVAQQPSNPPGWPSDWGFHSSVGTIVPSDYEMDQRVVNNTNGLGEHTITEALLDIPTMSITMPQDDFTGPSNGIYSHPTNRWERVCSVEYILPDGTPGFQEDSKIEMHGNSSRNPSRMQKHSMRLTFSSEVGASKLRYPLFPTTDVDEFNKLVLRACFTDSWALASWSTARYRPNDSMYIRDVWMKDSLGAMGQPTSHGNFVHLYVNGIYWGMHNLTERIEDDFLADHLGGEKEDWEVNEDFRDPEERWNTMREIDPSTPAGYAEIQNYIDLENFADYMLLHFYGDAEDWRDANGYAAANTGSGDGKFLFFVWDQEIVLDKFSWNRYDSSGRLSSIFLDLRTNEEFRMFFADRVQKHMFNGGALTVGPSVDRFLARCAEIDKAIMAESARWGDVQANTPYGSTASSSTNVDNDYYPPTLNDPIYFTREQHWLVERENVTGHYIPILHDLSDSRSIVNELRVRSLFPSIDAPTFSQHGGPVPSGHPLAITAPSGTIYYTLDGSDPREPGGAISPAAAILPTGSTVGLFQTGTVRSRALHNGEWSTLVEATFIVGDLASPSNLVVTEIYYNPPGSSEDTEFIELMNINPFYSIDLTDVSFVGITYSFPPGVTLNPLERIVVVKNQSAFAAAYNTAGLTIAPGEFADTSLDNSGEEIALIAQDGVTDIQRFNYDDEPNWPTSPDGDGYSLVLVAPETGPNHSDPLNWRPSLAIGGNPGTSDASPPFTGDPDLDLDKDGLTAFLEHTLGTSDSSPNTGDSLILGSSSFDDGTGTLREYLSITYQRNLAADEVIYQVQTSNSLAHDSWQSGIGFTTFVSSINNGDGTATVTYRSTNPISTLNREFLRLKVTSR